VRRHLDADPGAIAMRVDHDWFPMIDSAPNGGHIYQWTLGFHVSAFDIARKRGHTNVLDLLLARARPLDRLLDALWHGDDAHADALLAAEPQLVDSAPEKVLRQVAHAARNNNGAAVAAMLRHGFPVTALAQHGGMPLHWACFHGNPEMVAEALKYDPPLDLQDQDFKDPPMGWLVFGALHCWRGISTAQHAACAPLLLAAGAKVNPAWLPSGDDALDRVLRRHLVGE
jgi:hypothetical protein